MDDRVDIWMLLENSIQGILICDIKPFKGRSFPADELYAIQHLGRGVVEVIHYHHFVASFKERQRCEGADVTSATLEDRC